MDILPGWRRGVRRGNCYRSVRGVACTNRAGTAAVSMRDVAADHNPEAS